MRTLVLGGDDYLGCLTAMCLSARSDAVVHVAHRELPKPTLTWRETVWRGRS